MSLPNKPPAYAEPSLVTQALLDKAKQFFVPNYKPREMVLDRGQGARVWDLDGNEYIDLSAGISVTSLGHNDPELVNALVSQGQKLWHASNIFFNEPAIRLAEELVEAAPFARRAFFCNSGAEANEAAIKLARKFASLLRAPDRRQIVTFQGGFHGRTLATVTATAQPKYHEGFEPLPAGFRYCPFNDFEAASAAIGADTAAVLVEPIQGEGGVNLATAGFLAHLRRLCDDHGALLILDEVQSGMGRTGRLFAYEWEGGVIPDVVTMAKALGGGLPIGAMLVGEKAAEVLQFGSHGSTFGGNPVACAVARVMLRRIRNPVLLQNVIRQGAALTERLHEINRAHGLFTAIRGRGLIIGAELQGALKDKAGDLSDLCRRHGALVLQAGPNVLRFLPPLNITDEELQLGMDRVGAALESAVSR